jgi:outer membrane protein TolC
MKKNVIHKKLIYLISFYFFLFQNISVFSQTDSLTKYLEIAAKNNPLVLQRYDEYGAALQKVPQVGSLPDPELNIGVFLSPMELVSGNQVADIRLMQMFPWFGVLKNAKDEMGLMAKAKYESFCDAKSQVFYDVQRTWYELLKVQEDIRISKKSLDILQTLERLALVKFKSVSVSGAGNSSAGTNFSASAATNNSSSSSAMNSMGTNTGNNSPVNSTNSSMQSGTGGSGLIDLYRIQIEIGDLENNIALLKNQQSTIVARFNTYLNRPVESAICVPDSLKADSLNLSIPAVSDSMLNNNPMLGMLQYEQQSLDARKKMVTRMGYPMIGAGVNYSVINKNEMSASPMNGKDMIMPMVTVTLPIYRKKYKAMQTEVDLLKTSTQQGYQASANSLQAEYYEAIQLYQDAERRMKLYENQRQLVEHSLDIMIKSFASSEAGLNEVLTVRQQLLEYETKKVEAITDFNTSIAWLKRLGNIEIQ